MKRYQNLIKLIAVFACGSLGAFSFAPYGMTLMFFVSIIGLLSLLPRQGERLVAKAAKIGFFWGLGFFVFGLHWICHSLTWDLEKFWFLIPLCLLAIPSICALYYMGTISAFTHLTQAINYTTSARFKCYMLPLFFATLMTMGECLRGNLLTGFPWNLAAYIWHDNESIRQFVSMYGSYGLSFVTYWWSYVLWQCCYFLWQKQLRNSTNISGAIAQCLIAASLILIIHNWGKERIEIYSYKPANSISIRLVQPASFGHNPMAQREDTFTKLLSLSKAQGSDKVEILVWPESALTNLILTNNHNDHALDDTEKVTIRNLLYPGQILLTGADNYDVIEEKLYNAIAAIDHHGNVIALYRKIHLVPFGEYIPGRQILQAILPKNALQLVTGGMVDFSPGSSNEPFTINGIAICPLVCYEAIFPGIISTCTQSSNAIVNMTNDSWFGESCGLFQHFNIARFRAIESGIPIVRVATTGISAIIDPLGQVINTLPPGAEGVIDGKIPPVIFCSYNEKTYLLLLIFMLVIFIVMFTYNRRCNLRK